MGLSNHRDRIYTPQLAIIDTSVHVSSKIKYPPPQDELTTTRTKSQQVRRRKAVREEWLIDFRADILPFCPYELTTITRSCQTRVRQGMERALSLVSRTLLYEKRG